MRKLSGRWYVVIGSCVVVVRIAFWLGLFKFNAFSSRYGFVLTVWIVNCLFCHPFRSKHSKVLVLTVQRFHYNHRHTFKSTAKSMFVTFYFYRHFSWHSSGGRLTRIVQRSKHFVCFRLHHMQVAFMCWWNVWLWNRFSPSIFIACERMNAWLNDWNGVCVFLWIPLKIGNTNSLGRRENMINIRFNGSKNTPITFFHRISFQIFPIKTVSL